MKRKGSRRKYSPTKRQNSSENRTDKKPQSSDETAETVDNEISYACFKVGKEFYAMNLDSVLEVLHTYEITTVPHLPTAFSGVLQLRGGSIPVLDLQKLLHESNGNAGNKNCLVASIGATNIGFIIDSDIVIVSLENGTVYPLPDSYTKNEAAFLDGVLKHDTDFYGILNPKGVIETLTDWREDYAET